MARRVGGWYSKEADRGNRFVCLFFAEAFTVLAAGAWYALAFVVRPFG